MRKRVSKRTKGKQWLLNNNSSVPGAEAGPLLIELDQVALASIITRRDSFKELFLDATFYEVVLNRLAWPYPILALRWHESPEALEGQDFIAVPAVDRVEIDEDAAPRLEYVYVAFMQDGLYFIFAEKHGERQETNPITWAALEAALTPGSTPCPALLTSSLASTPASSTMTTRATSCSVSSSKRIAR